MITTSFSGDLIGTALRQLGASEIREIRNGILYIIRIEFAEDLHIVYVLDVTKKDKYFLQRVSPYPMSHGRFSSANEVVQFIERDIKKFENATHSNNFNQFLEIADGVTRLSHAMELLFLERNVSKEDMDKISNHISETVEKLKVIRDHSPKIQNDK